MIHLQVLLAVIVLTGASGVLQAARPEAAPEEDSFTLYTPSLPGDTFSCSAVNVSHKTLEMTFTILDVNGVPFQVAGNPTPHDPSLQRWWASWVPSARVRRPAKGTARLRYLGPAIAMTSAWFSPPRLPERSPAQLCLSSYLGPCKGISACPAIAQRHSLRYTVGCMANS